MSERRQGVLVLGAKLVLSGVVVVWLTSRLQSTEGLAAAWRVFPWAALPLVLLQQVFLRWVYVRQLAALFTGVGAPLPIGQIFRAQSLSALAALGLPGDFAAGAVAWHLLTKNGAGRALTGTLLLVARLVLLAALLPLALFGVWATGGIGLPPLALPVFAGLTLAATAVGFLAKPALAERLARGLPPGEVGRENRWMGLLRALLEAGRQVLQLTLPRRMAVTAWALGSHLIVLVGLILALRGAGVEISTGSACLAVGAVNVVQALPFAFSGAGVRELTVVALLERLHGAPPEQTLAATVLLFVASTLVTLGLGLVALFMPGGRHERTNSAEPAGSSGRAGE